MIIDKPEYIGDAVFVNLDNCQSVVLMTGSHKEEEAENIIFMEPSVTLKLLIYLDRYYPEIISSYENYRNSKR